MRTKDINISDFKNIEEVYSFLEKNAFQLEREWDLRDLFVTYRTHTSDDGEKQKAQWELEFFMFQFKGTQIFSLSYSTGKNIGEVKKYPDLDEFQQAAFDYLKLRAKSTHNPLLLAWYNHLLWKAPKGVKHRSYALLAFENYIKSIHEFYALFGSDGAKENLVRVGRKFEILVGLCEEIKSGFVELKALAKYLLFKASSLDFFIKHGIIEDMLEHPNIFKKEDFEKVLNIYRKEINRDHKKSDDLFLVNYYIPTAIKVATKIGADVKKWHYEAGLAYLRMAEDESQPERFWLKLDHYAKAIHAFTFAGSISRKKATEKLYSELKPLVILPSHRIELSEEEIKAAAEFDKRVKEVTAGILKSPADEIYRAISQGFFFPRYNDVLKAANGTPRDFTEFGTTIYFDKNKNISRNKDGDEKDRNFYATYQWQISMKVLPYLHYTLASGIKSGHLTFENFIRYIAANTWMGKPFVRTDLGGEPEEINWIPLISPAIYEYFIQVQAWDSSKYYKPSFVLCIDSLTLKMEGLFRNFCERIAIPVSVGRSKSMQEAYIHNLLEHPTIKKYFNDDDLLFFNYLFASSHGMNLRNNVAHCFYNIDEYHPDKMLLLIAALLRIGKYNHKKK
ncbi:MAG: DUF4209 domain-containing protein [Bacteroidetes bacterium]|nr:DUF4209 domain-containing protein [Bacteroidota bacterium]